METEVNEHNSNPQDKGRQMTHDQPAPLTKMTSGGQELRDHDFPTSQEQAHRPRGPVALAANAPPPEAERSGGVNGTVSGDSQNAGAVGTIVNQDAADPDNNSDR
jgi:hypothetical protein